MTKNSSACKNSQKTLPEARALEALEHSKKAIPSLSDRTLHTDPSIETDKTSLELLCFKCIHRIYLLISFIVRYLKF